ncbi:hypothetical protein M427DRAFT_56937 [Gonapodya prolifera JEL478]|uniref:Uncharacterized protein n=1 Tax=Gonapodya prolifera (strain JEL478) TaxID=1344416 RepID=A0A139AEZ3_GONPJ|nr:hypothetical protein M427DRAFT_56937 [Gonapodya prolifera JEL478]|eukprot:KXS15320.1 hypothetical protein M427DRAFT_56937 [Gonapodya prolifera JEL478]
MSAIAAASFSVVSAVPATRPVDAIDGIAQGKEGNKVAQGTQTDMESNCGVQDSQGAVCDVNNSDEVDLTGKKPLAQGSRQLDNKYIKDALTSDSSDPSNGDAFSVSDVNTMSTDVSDTETDSDTDTSADSHLHSPPLHPPPPRPSQLGIDAKTSLTTLPAYLAHLGLPNAYIAQLTVKIADRFELCRRTATGVALGGTQPPSSRTALIADTHLWRVLPGTGSGSPPPPPRAHPPSRSPPPPPSSSRRAAAGRACACRASSVAF